nr:endocuticle structural glycoprotein SgAbd-2-like [Penaeus vannamei]
MAKGLKDKRCELSLFAYNLSISTNLSKSGSKDTPAHKQTVEWSPRIKVTQGLYKLPVVQMRVSVANLNNQYELCDSRLRGRRGRRRPQYAYETPAPTYLAPAASTRDQSAELIEFVPILRDDRVHEDDGRYNLDVETANGISMSQSGSPDGPDGAIVKAGQYSYTAPDGSLIEIKFVANENGFQPQGAHLPVAPEFPHRSLSSSSTRSPSPPRRTPPVNVLRLRLPPRAHHALRPASVD